MGKTGISVKMNEKDASLIGNQFSFNEVYLKSLIEKYVLADTRENVDSMDYTELKRYGYVIKGVAIKILKNKTNQLEKKTGAEQLSLF